MKIIVIGNGSNVYKKENGREIDNFDYVVRMGNCCIKGFEKYIGTKTDMYRVQWQNLFYEEKNNIYPRVNHIYFKDLLLSTFDSDLYEERTYRTSHQKKIYERYDTKISVTHNIIREYTHYKKNNRILHDYWLHYFSSIFNIHNVYFIPPNVLQQAVLNINTPCSHEHFFAPSNGIITLFYMIHYFPKDEIFITGFDGFRTRNYWTTAVETDFETHNSLREQIVLKKLLKTGKLIQL